MVRSIVGAEAPLAVAAGTLGAAECAGPDSNALGSEVMCTAPPPSSWTLGRFGAGSIGKTASTVQECVDDEDKFQVGTNGATPTQGLIISPPECGARKNITEAKLALKRERGAASATAPRRALGFSTDGLSDVLVARGQLLPAPC